MSATAAMAGTVNASFTSAGSVQAYGYYIGPYTGTINGTTTTLYCEDLAHHVSVNQTWTANLSAITPNANLSLTRFGSLPSAISLYEQAAWLTTQYASQPQTNWGDIQAAIWQLFDSSAPTSTAATQWRTSASSNYQSINYTGFEILTNTGLNDPNTTQVQEFILQPTPEPGTSLLLGAGLTLLAAVGMRRMKRTATDRS